MRVTVQLKLSDNPLFGKESDKPTELRIEMMPEEKVYFVIQTKAPGLEDTQTSAEMVLRYKDAFSDKRIPDAYETVMLAVLQGDQTMCKRKFGLSSGQLFGRTN